MNESVYNKYCQCKSVYGLHKEVTVDDLEFDSNWGDFDEYFGRF